jgi:3-deoxy-manno-octulosonate cytidylyltransferase (CMP-KDO synthetase)
MLIVGCFQISGIRDVRLGILIPARMASVRLPGKPLLEIQGLPMIEHVRRRALLTTLKIEVIVISGDDEIIEVVRNNNGSHIKTLKNHLNGLSRAHEAMENLDWTHVIVLQGDEILILPEYLDQLIEEIIKHPKVSFWNITTKLESDEEITNHSVVKCTLQLDSKIQTIFRQSPLICELQKQLELTRKITGIFALNRQTLLKIANSAPTPIESAESIEQMKVLELGISISTIEVLENFPSVNLISDIDSVLQVLKNHKIQKELSERIGSI